MPDVSEQRNLGSFLLDDGIKPEDRLECIAIQTIPGDQTTEVPELYELPAVALDGSDQARISLKLQID